MGIFSWLVLLLISLNQWSTITQIHLLIVFGIGVLTPLSLRIAISISRHNTIPHLAHIILRIQPIIPILAIASLALPQGEPSALLASGWLIQSTSIAILGFINWAGRSTRTVEELCMDMGLMLTSISGIWFFFYRLSGEFFGFKGVFVPLTAAHFVTIGMGALIVAGCMGRQLRHQHRVTSIYRLIAWITIISPIVVALGITHTNLIATTSLTELVGVILLSTSFVALSAYYLLKIRQFIQKPVAQWVLTVSSLTLLVTMILAVGYSVGQYTSLFAFAIPDMVHWHGWLNAMGFAGLGVVGWNIVMPGAIGQPSGIPLSQISGGLRIGSQFFESIGAIDPNKADVTGLVDDLSEYESEICQVANLSPRVVRFYENTAEHRLYVHPQWATSFKYLAKIYKWFARRVNQMNLPLQPEAEDAMIDSRIVPLKDTLDGRKQVRGWVRTITDTDEVIYVAAYASHTHDNKHYMNIAFPLPYGNITSILKLKTFEKGNQTNLSLYSINGVQDIGDQGVYFVTKWLTLRLPFNEIIDVYVHPPPDLPSDILFHDRATLFARHRMWVFGYPFLTLYYMIWQDTL